MMLEMDPDPPPPPEDGPHSFFFLRQKMMEAVGSEGSPKARKPLEPTVRKNTELQRSHF